MEDYAELLEDEGYTFRPVGLTGGLTPQFAPRLNGGRPGLTRT